MTHSSFGSFCYSNVYTSFRVLLLGLFCKPCGEALVFREILFCIGLLLSKEVKRIKKNNGIIHFWFLSITLIKLNNAELGLGILKSRVNDASRRHIPRRRATINNPSWIINDVKQAIGRRQRAYETKRRINNEETVAEYIAARTQVKRIVKQEKRNELSIARICEHNPQSYSYVNERIIVRDNIGPLKTLDGIVITTDNDMANTMNNYFSSVFNHSTTE